MTRRGGFRTRFLPAWARLIVRVVLRLPDTLRAGLEAEWDEIQAEDRQRACPHPPAMRRWYAVDYERCHACGAVTVPPRR